MGEALARRGIGDMHRTLDPRLGPRHHGDGAGRYRRRDEVLAVHTGALEGAEHGARCDLAVVDREAGDGRALGPAGQRGELHSTVASFFSPGADHNSGNRSETSTSRLSSGSTPSIAPVRAITRLTTGAAVHAAVVRPKDSALPTGESSIATIT